MITAYLRLFRWQNLLFIIVTQLLVRYAVVIPFLHSIQTTPIISDMSYLLMILATILISAGGYAINDYFDIRADRINKPDKVIVGRLIPRRKVILWHLGLSTAGFLAGTWVAYKTQWWPLVPVFALIPFLLWIYSVHYKKRPFSGNFIIALLTATAVALGWIVDYSALVAQGHSTNDFRILHFIIAAYTVFAFLITLVREIVKDMEDIKGDSRTGCRTLPVKYGMRKTKATVSVTIVIIIAILLMLQINLIKQGFDLFYLYILLLIQLPLLLVIHKTITAFEKYDYHIISLLSKLIMAAGVLSMILVGYYIQNPLSLTL